MNLILLVCFVASFLIVLALMPSWIKHARRVGLVGGDMHKIGRPKVAEMGGVITMLGFLFGVLFYIALDTFYLQGHVSAELSRDLQVMAALATVLILSFLGVVDDLLGWKIGLRQWQKPIIAMFAAMPVIVVNAGHSTMAFPFLGLLDLGLLYPLLLIPVAISGASNAFNMLAGYNGLEAGLGVLILLPMAYVAWVTNSSWVSMIAMCMVFALLAFLVFNRNPARVFPGDTLTYPVGALIAIIAILGNMEKFALVLFIPYFIEFALKLRGFFRKESFSSVNSDGSLDVPSRKVYSLTHVGINVVGWVKGRVYEKDVVRFVYIVHLFFVFLAFIVRG